MSDTCTFARDFPLPTGRDIYHKHYQNHIFPMAAKLIWDQPPTSSHHRAGDSEADVGSVHLGIFPAAFPPFLSKTSTYGNDLNVPLNKDDPTKSKIKCPKSWKIKPDHYTFLPLIIEPLIYDNQKYNAGAFSGSQRENACHSYAGTKVPLGPAHHPALQQNMLWNGNKVQDVCVLVNMGRGPKSTLELLLTHVQSWSVHGSWRAFILGHFSQKWCQMAELLEKCRSVAAQARLRMCKRKIHLLTWGQSKV